MSKYDLVVIGSGPAGEKAATKAAYFNKKVAIIEKKKVYGGAGLNTGTIPSKALKQTAVFLSGKYDKNIYGIEKKLEKEASVNEFMYLKNDIIHKQQKKIERNISRDNINIYHGCASFVDKHTVQLDDQEKTRIQGKFILIATGSYPYHPKNINFDFEKIHDSDSILRISRFPKSICILGAGVIGCEYATIFATMGIQTYLINNSSKILDFLDYDISQALVNEMHKSNIKIIFETTLDKIIKPTSSESSDLLIKLKNGQNISCDMFLFAAGRSGAIGSLNLDAVGIESDTRETIKVNQKFQTSIKNIYAVGDVIGFPALASTSMDQGRVAVSHMFQIKDFDTIQKLLPFGIYTIPEVSMVGLTEQETKDKKKKYVTGTAYCTNIARGQLLAANYGFLKIVVEYETGILSGVHMIGPLATEIIHYGMLLIFQKTRVQDIIGHVFNHPTLHELYKYASFDAIQNIKHLKSE